MPSRRRGLPKRSAALGLVLLVHGCTSGSHPSRSPPASALSGPTLPVRAGPCDLLDAAAVTRTLGPLSSPPQPVQRTDGRACVFSASRDRTFVLFLHPRGFLRVAAARFPPADLTTGDGMVSVQGTRTAAVLLDASDLVVGVYGPSSSFAEVAELAELAEVALDQTGSTGTGTGTGAGAGPGDEPATRG